MWSMGLNLDLPLANHSELNVSLLLVYLYGIFFFFQKTDH